MKSFRRWDALELELVNAVYPLIGIAALSAYEAHMLVNIFLQVREVDICIILS